MWIILDIEGMQEIEMIDYLQQLNQLFNLPITLTLNSIIPAEYLMEITNRVIQACQENLDINIGPQFAEEGVLIDDKIVADEKLLYATIDKKILWYLKNNQVPNNNQKVILVSKHVDLAKFNLKANIDKLPPCEYCCLPPHFDIKREIGIEDEYKSKPR